MEFLKTYSYKFFANLIEMQNQMTLENQTLTESQGTLFDQILPCKNLVIVTFVLQAMYTPIWDISLSLNKIRSFTEAVFNIYGKNRITQ